ncbi:MAG: MFS transporter [Nitrososphaerota archaeon]
MNIGYRIIELINDINHFKRDTKLMILSDFLAWIAFGLYSTVFQFYLIYNGYDGTMLGTIFMITNATSSILMIPGGLIADYYGKKKVLIIGTLMSILPIMIMLFSTYFPIVAFSAVILGLSYAFSWPTFSALFADTMDKKEMDFGFSVNAFFQSFSFAIGSILSWTPNILSMKFNYTLVDSYKFTLGIIALLMFLSTIPLFRIKSINQLKGKRKLNLKIRSSRVALKYMVANAIVAFGAGITIQMFGYYFYKKFGIKEDAYGTLSFITNIVCSPTFLIAPKLSQKIGILTTIIYTQLASIPGLIFITFSPNFAIASIIYIYRQTLMNMTNPLIGSLLMKLVKEEERATVNSLSNLSWSISNALGMPIGGYIMDNIMVDLPPYLTSAFYLFYVIIFYILMKNELYKIN